MARVCKRKKNTHKQRQLISKRNWLLHRPAKGEKRPQSKAKSSQLTTKSKQERNNDLVNLLAESVLCNNEQHRRDNLKKTESFLRCFILSLNYTARTPISLFCACMSLCSNGLNKSLNAVNNGKEKVHSRLSSSMVNGYSQIKKVVGYVGDTLFPSRPYKRKLDEMSGRLDGVEKELKRLKRDIMFNQQTSRNSVTLTSISNSDLTVTSAIPPPSLPPPPPPPPPPICQPPPVISFKRTQKVDEGGVARKKEPKTVGISLEELVNVKLKKIVREDNNKENISSPLTFGLRRCDSGRRGSPRKQDSSNHPFITLKDIKKVSLRKTQTNSVKKSRSPGQSKLAFLKTNLRKVRVERSPGGTPVVDKSKETYGEGLTPIMTRALQRKFKFANPPSPVDLFNETNSFVEKTFTRASPCSPMTRLKALR